MALSIRIVQRLVTLVLLTLALTWTTRVTAVDTPPLSQLAQMFGFRMGTAVQAQPLVTDMQYQQVLSREFNLITPENALKFRSLSPQRGQYIFSSADSIVDFAQSRGMQLRGHTLVWHNANPAWLVNGTFSREEMIAILRQHILTVVGHYRGRIAYWDVVNEAVGPTGGYRSSSLWMQRIGPEYIEMAFRFAHEADPDALLFYSDYSNEGMNVKSDFIFTLVRDLLARGVPIHGVGFHLHTRIDSPPDPNRVRENIQRLETLGLHVQITEMDVRTQTTATIDDPLGVQAQIYQSMLDVCLGSSACTSFTTWGFTDRYTWLRGDNPLPFDLNYQPKPAYFTMQQALAARVMAGQGSPPIGPGIVMVVKDGRASGQNVRVSFDLQGVQDLFGLQVSCQADPAVMTAVNVERGAAFSEASSLLVDNGFKADTGNWTVAASRLNPQPPVSGDAPGFVLVYTRKSDRASSLECSAIAVNRDGLTLPLALLESAPSPELAPAVAARSLASAPGGTISGMAGYQSLPTSTGITVQLIDGLTHTLVNETRTDSGGVFVFPDVLIGSYLLRLSAPMHLAVEQTVAFTGAGEELVLNRLVLPAGDTDQSGIIDLMDASLVAANFSLALPPAPSNADLNGDLQVNIVDLTLVGANFGRAAPPAP